MGKKVINFLNSPITSFVFGSALLVGWCSVLVNSGLDEFEPISFISGALLHPIIELTGPPMWQFGRWIRNKITRG